MIYYTERHKADLILTYLSSNKCKFINLICFFFNAYLNFSRYIKRDFLIWFILLNTYNYNL